MTDKTINVGDKIKLSQLGVDGGIAGVPIGSIGTVIFIDSDETLKVKFPYNEVWWCSVENAIIDKIEKEETEKMELGKIIKKRDYPIIWSVNDSNGRPDYVCATRKEARTYVSYGRRVVKYLAESDVEDTATVKGDTIWAVVKKDGNQFIDSDGVDGFWTRQGARDWIDGDSTMKVVKYVAVKS